MKEIVGETLAKRLVDWGVDTVFGLPGDGNCDVNPNEPPMPGKVEYEQATSFTEAFLRGEPHKIATLATVARDKINQLRS